MNATKILDSYKSQITHEQYMQNLSVIGSFAIEGMDLSEDDIKDLIRIDKGENPENIIKEKLEKLGIKQWPSKNLIIF